MNSKELYDAYQVRKEQFHNYINIIKQNAPRDIYTIVNPTLIKNPYASNLPLNFFQKDIETSSKYIFFLKSICRYYFKNMYLFYSYIFSTILYKIYYQQNINKDLKIIIDTFGLVDKVIDEERFNENYLVGIYDIFEKFNTPYTILLRLYKVGKNPFKLKRFFQILNQEKQDFIFEYEFLNIVDFFELLMLIILYPFRMLRLLQKEQSTEDIIFNHSLIQDLKYFSFDSLTRYILGKKLAKIESITTIYSWSEFQVIERSFNYAIRKNSEHIRLIALQFYLNYEVYFNAYIDDLDDEILSSPHKVFVNGKYYLQNRKRIHYDIGVSLRYKDIFDFSGIKEEENILLLGSYIEKDTRYMLQSVKKFKKVIFKNHPAVKPNTYQDLPKNITISKDNIYKLFENAKIVIGTASGTAIEAVACGLSVIIIASNDNLTANPLVEYGQGKIWDIIFDINEIEKVCNQLMIFRKNHQNEIKEIAKWYKDNFFMPLTEQNLIKTFGFNQ